jgi:hypothetical protein
VLTTALASFTLGFKLLFNSNIGIKDVQKNKVAEIEEMERTIFAGLCFSVDFSTSYDYLRLMEFDIHPESLHPDQPTTEFLRILVRTRHGVERSDEELAQMAFDPPDEINDLVEASRVKTDSIHLAPDRSIF